MGETETQAHNSGSGKHGRDKYSRVMQPSDGRRHLKVRGPEKRVSVEGTFSTDLMEARRWVMRRCGGGVFKAEGGRAKGLRQTVQSIRSVGGGRGSLARGLNAVGGHSRG